MRRPKALSISKPRKVKVEFGASVVCLIPSLTFAAVQSHSLSPAFRPLRGVRINSYMQDCQFVLAYCSTQHFWAADPAKSNTLSARLDPCQRSTHCWLQRHSSTSQMRSLLYRNWSASTEAKLRSDSPSRAASIACGRMTDGLNASLSSEPSKFTKWPRIWSEWFDI